MQAAQFIEESQKTVRQSPLRGKPAGLPKSAETGPLLKIENELGVLAEKCQEPLKIVLLGEVKAGKSTLLNALAGAQVSPVNVTEATACILEVSWSREESAVLLRRRGAPTTGSPVEIFELLSKHQNDQAFFADCEAVKITRPLPRLKQLLLVDTPGLATLTEQNSAKTQRYFQQADVVLWVLNANYLGQSDTNDELRAVAKMGKPIVAVLNRIDEIDGTPEKCVRYVQRELGIYVKSVFPLSAKGAMNAVESGNARELKTSGFSDLLQFLETNIERQVDAVHNESLINSARALLTRELLLHKEYLADLAGRLLIVKNNQEKLRVKSQITRDYHHNRVQAWFSQEFLAEKERVLTAQIDGIPMLSMMGSHSTDMNATIAKLFAEDSIRLEIDTFLGELDRNIREDWQENLKLVQQEIAVEYENVTKKYHMEAQALIKSMPSIGKSAINGLGEGVAVGGVAGTAMAVYSAVLGPMSSAISIGTALSATLPPLLLAGAAAGAVIGLFKFSTEKKGYHRVVAETVAKIRENVRATALPGIARAIDGTCEAIVDRVQEQLVVQEFAGLKPEAIQLSVQAMEKYCGQLDMLRLKA